MGKYEQPPGKGEHKAERTRKRDSVRERGEREKAKDEETDNKWDDAPHDGLPQASATTWNYTTKNRSGEMEGGVVHWSIRIGWLSCRKNPVSNRVWRDCLVTRASITAWAKQQLPLSSLTSNSSLPHRLRQSGVALKQMSWYTNVSVWLRCGTLRCYKWMRSAIIWEKCHFFVFFIFTKAIRHMLWDLKSKRTMGTWLKTWQDISRCDPVPLNSSLLSISLT